MISTLRNTLPSHPLFHILQSPELELLVCCSRTQLTATQIERVQTLVQEDLNWQYLVEVATKHCVLPLLARHLKAIASISLPAAVQQKLQQTFRTNLEHNLVLTAELIKLVTLFESQSLAVLSFKGPILAQVAYGHLGLRQFLDLDILVPEEQAVQAIQLLIEQNYEPQFDLTRSQQETYVKLRNELSFWHSEKQIAVDLHWEILLRYYSFSPTPDMVWSRCDRVPLAGNAIPTLSRENLLLFLCAHGAKHGWSRLYWICDIAELIKHSPNLNWQIVQSQVGQFGTQRMLFLGLYLAHHLFDTELPPEIEQKLALQPELWLIWQQIQGQLWKANKDSNDFKFDQRIYFKTLESWKDKVWYWLDTIMTPTPLEWKIILLPQRLFFLYYPIRLLRLAWKYIVVLNYLQGWRVERGSKLSFHNHK